MIPAIFEIGYTLVTVFLLGYFISISLQKRWRKAGEMKWWMLFGFIFNLLGFTWLYTVYPLIWMPEGGIQLLGIVLLHLLLSAGSALPFVITGYAFYKVRSFSKHIRPLIIATSFTLTEMLRSIVISLLYYGDKTTIDLHFNAGTIGNTLSSTPLIELAYYGGTFALTFVLTYLIYAILSLSLKEALHHYLIIISIFLVTHFFVPTRTPEKDLFVGIVTSDIPTSRDDELLEKMKESNRLVASLMLEDKNKKDIIVLPEDSRFLSSLSQEERMALEEAKAGTLIVDGDTIAYDAKLATISFFVEAGQNKASWRGKEFLLPFNEYIPYFFDVIFGFFIGDELESYKSRHTYTQMPSGKTVLFNGVRVGTLICSEILSFRMIENMGDERPDIIFFQSRLNVFNNNPLFLMHLRSFSKIAAAQLRTPILSSNNYAPSYLISARGAISATIPVSTSYSTILLKRGGAGVSEVILNK